MAILAGVSVLAGTAPVWAIINADLSFGACLALSALAGFLVSIAGNLSDLACMVSVYRQSLTQWLTACEAVGSLPGKALGSYCLQRIISSSCPYSQHKGLYKAYHFPRLAHLVALACCHTFDKFISQSPLVAHLYNQLIHTRRLLTLGLCRAQSSCHHDQCQLSGDTRSSAGPAICH